MITVLRKHSRTTTKFAGWLFRIECRADEFAMIQTSVQKTANNVR